jgi:ParB family chromosome partitioning protein
VGSLLPRRPAPVEVAAKVVRDGDEWYTPAHIIEAARKVMGGIDVDPASCEAANAIIGAGVFFDKQTDGRMQAWLGRFWLNPPYSETGEWIAALLDQITDGNAVEGFVLVNAKVESGWFDQLWSISPVICFVRGRISFVAGDGGKSQTGYYGQAIAYVGPNRAAFIDVFSEFGRLAAVLQPAEVVA